MVMRFHHGMDEKDKYFRSDKVHYYTYRKPKVTSVTLSDYTISPQNTLTIYAGFNKRMWDTNLEKDFESYIYINEGNNITELSSVNNQTGKDTSEGYGVSTYTYKAIISSSISKQVFNDAKKGFTVAERSQASCKKKIYVRRKNVSAKRDDTDYKYAELTMQYQPTQKPTVNNFSTQGKTIITQDVPSISLNWTYPYTTIASGVVDKYIVEVYDNSKCTGTKISTIEIIGKAEKEIAGKWTTYTEGVNGITMSSNLVLDTMVDLKRGKMNYAKIIPVYKYPNGTGSIQGTQYTIVQLVKPVSRLETPVIDYPKHQKTWNSKDFRVLLKCPNDQDLSEIKKDVSGVSDTTYEYDNIEFKISAGYSASNISVNKTFNNFITDKAMYSCTDLIGHNKGIAILPAINSAIGDYPYYKFNIRFKKKYYFDTETEDLRWSKYSSEVELYKTGVDEYTVNYLQDKIIKIDEYSRIYSLAKNCYDAYPIFSPLTAIQRYKEDKILYADYDKLNKTAIGIKNGINNYCTYQNTNIRLNKTIDELGSASYQDYITAEKNKTHKVDNSDISSGKNYINICIENFNKLK